MLDDAAREVTDLSSETQPGRWIGSASPGYGFNGFVEPRQLADLLDGHPSGSNLTRSNRTRVGFDLIFAAPKCVSVAFSSPERARAQAIVHAQRRAVDEALRYLESRAIGVRRRVDGVDHLRGVEGVAAAEFTHGSSRSGDPHLHSHVVLANLARGDDGRFGAIDSRGLYAHRRAADAIYRAQLRHDLSTSLGFIWESDPAGGAHLAGISDAEELALSGRSAEVRSGTRERPMKIAQTRADAERLWLQRRKDAPELDNRSRRRCDARFLDEHRFGAIVHEDPLTPRLVVTAWADAAPAGLETATVARAIRQIGQPLGLGVSEPVLAVRKALPSRRSLRLLGPRPVERVALERWWNAGRAIEWTATDRLGPPDPGEVSPRVQVRGGR